LALTSVLYRTVARVDYSSCVKCGLCARACPIKAIDWAPRSYPRVNVKLCTGCSICVQACPKGSIGMVRVFSVLPVMVALSLIILLALVVYAIHISTTPQGVVVEGGGSNITSVESWYEVYKERVWAGKATGDLETRDPLSIPSGG